MISPKLSRDIPGGYFKRLD